MKLDAARTRPTPRPAADGGTVAQAKATTRIQAKMRGKSGSRERKVAVAKGEQVRLAVRVRAGSAGQAMHQGQACRAGQEEAAGFT